MKPQSSVSPEFVIRRISLLFLLAVPLFVNGCVVLLYKSLQQDRDVAARHGKKYTYRVKPAPAFLSEELALAKAWQTLAREGFDTNQWRLVAAPNPALAPDNIPDHYFARMRLTGSNPARGTIKFRRGEVRRRFDIFLDGNRIICHSLFTGTRSKSFKVPAPPLKIEAPSADKQ